MVDVRPPWIYNVTTQSGTNTNLRRSAMWNKLLWILLVVPVGGVGLKFAYC